MLVISEMTERPPLPDEDEGAPLTRVSSAEMRIRREAQNMGRIGVWFGSRHNAALYFAGTLMLLAMILLAFFAWLEPPMRPDIVKVFAGVLAAALGFIGGLLGSQGRSQ
jgi:hypothetical protein